MKDLTVDNAIKIGRFVINVPVIMVFIIGFTGSISLASKYEFPALLILGFPLTFMLTWITWSFVITQWKIWAYSNCRNVHELKRRALNEQLIWSDGLNLKKYELRTSKQKLILANLQNKFTNDDIEIKVKDDGTIPNETYIYYSKIPNFLLICFCILIFVYGILLIQSNETIGYFIVIISLIGLYLVKRQPNSKNAILELNSKGIKPLGKPIISWSKLIRSEIRLIGFGDAAKWFLYLEKKNKNIDEIEINDLNVSPRKIEKLIKVYKQRSEKNR